MESSRRNEKTILFLINKLTRGGAERMFVNEVNALYKAGYPVYIGTLFPQADVGLLSELELPQERVTCFNFSSTFDGNGRVRLRSFIAEHDIATMYSTLENANIVARLARMRVSSVKVVIRESNDARAKAWKFKFLDIALNFYTDGIIAVSKGVRDSLMRYQPMHAGKIAIVENGVPIPSIDFDDVFNKKDVIPIRILSVGSLTWQKNHMALLEVFRELRQEILDIKLTIAGRGMLQEELENFVRENRLEKNVTFTGSVDKDELQTLYRESHVFVLSSRWEGFPNVVLEAMSFGLPAVAKEVSGVKDAIVDGVTGYVVVQDSPDAMKEQIRMLVQNRNLRYDMGRKALERARTVYSMEQHIQALLQVLQ